VLIPLSDSYIKNKFIYRVLNSKEKNNQEKQSTWFVDIQGVVLLINCFAVLTAFLGQFWCRTGTWRNWVAFQKRLDIVGVCGSIVGVSVPFGVASTTSLGIFMSGINFVRYLAAMHACTKTAPGCCENRWGEDSSLIGCS